MTSFLPCWQHPLTGLNAAAREPIQATGEGKSLRFGVIADVHLGMMGDETGRLREFVTRMVREEVDFIIQLGDFCHVTRPASKAFIEIWNRFPGPRYHVLGNHEMDLASKETVMHALGMKAPYYSFDAGDLHAVVLDPNYMKADGKYIDSDRGNDSRFAVEQLSHVPPHQIEWLKRDLAATDRCVIVFSHQGLGYPGDTNVANQSEVQAVLEEANTKAGFRKVVACFAGHMHQDRYQQIGGIHYVQINSASYFWLGLPRARLVGYQDPLYAMVTIRPDGGILISGRQSQLLPPPLDELGVPEATRKVIRPAVSARSLHFTPRRRASAS